jgi:hypothetical protein
VTLRITYPRSKAKKYSKWIDRIDKEFVRFAKNEQKGGTSEDEQN